MATPKQTDPQFKLRFSPDLRDQVEAAAKENNRSMNAEIVARLEASFSRRQIGLERQSQRLEDRLESFERQLATLVKLSTSVLENHRKTLADPDARTPTQVAYDEGYHAYLSDPVYKNPYSPKDGLHLSFQSGFRHAFAAENKTMSEDEARQKHPELFLRRSSDDE